MSKPTAYTSKPILCLDFDGVLHSYESGWQGADKIPDPVVPGAMRFIHEASDRFKIAIFSSRSNERAGIEAMQVWLRDRFDEYWNGHQHTRDKIISEIEWPTQKPKAFVTIDDRAICFDGTWPTMETLNNFKPWNKR